jgi:hypothetical protein
MEEEEKKINQDKATGKLAEKQMNSPDAGMRNDDLNKYSKDYEIDDKKDIEFLVKGTIVPDDGKAHQDRANKFGFNLNKFTNRDKIRGVYITSANEKFLIPGLVDFLIRGAEDKVDKKNVIALVMTEIDKDDVLHLVGVDGHPLAEGLDPLENGIFQVKPLPKLRWAKKEGQTEGESAFRDTVPDDVQEDVRKQYGQLRESIKKQAAEVKEVNDLLGLTHTIEASFGIPDYVRKGDKTSSPIDYDTRTSVEDAKLADAIDLKNHIVLDIPSLSFSSAGVVFSCAFVGGVSFVVFF